MALIVSSATGAVQRAFHYILPFGHCEKFQSLTVTRPVYKSGESGYLPSGFALQGIVKNTIVKHAAMAFALRLVPTDVAIYELGTSGTILAIDRARTGPRLEGLVHYHKRERGVPPKARPIICELVSNPESRFVVFGSTCYQLHATS
ncbi:hypothetical protein DSL72_005625 [Monilinia vaccinii-corymbosi]|uniref:Uncharacterized protein n=1 Tax=Monilinia vaccinii-corymbosi TaxID=61207 RepID=A0A8A3PG68_9HELO|nr:hypothetical protein DSL72_005625 [Monilinia vaccinii-corymbosi]